MTETIMTRDETAVTTNPDTGASAADSAIARKAMIDSQLRTSGVNEEFALARMMAVPREQYLPADKQALAYIDRSVTFAGGALASPLFYGKALIEAHPVRDDKVLVVGGGTGYLAALLEPLVSSVNSVDAATAANGTIEGQYSLVMVDGAIEQLPQGLSACVKEGGQVVSGLLLRQVTRLASGRKIAGQIVLQPLEDMGIPVLHEFDSPKKWTFS